MYDTCWNKFKGGKGALWSFILGLFILQIYFLQYQFYNYLSVPSLTHCHVRKDRSINPTCFPAVMSRPKPQGLQSNRWSTGWTPLSSGFPFALVKAWLCLGGQTCQLECSPWGLASTPLTPLLYGHLYFSTLLFSMPHNTDISSHFI